MKKLGKIRLLRDRLLLLVAILAGWRRPVASVVALDPLHRAMRTVLYRRTTMSGKTAGKYGAFSSFFVLMRTLSSAGAIRCEYSPDDGVQWLRAKPWTPSIGRYRRCRAGA